MNRKLKFRVWDKLERRFINPDKGYQGHYVLTLDGKFQNLQNGSGGDEYVVQQFTGLKDKNGKEIYEGDIIKFFENVIGRIEYLVNNFGCHFAIVYKSPEFNNQEVTNDLAKYPVMEDYEIIGNIFENE